MRPLLLLSALLLAAACRPAEPPLFERLAPEATGVTFENTLAEGPDFNILNYLYYYNGGGVAAGDVDGDGRADLYFTANEGPNRLYLNRGGFRFEDVTEAAGVAGDADWTTGVTLADVDGDGRLDLYVAAVGAYLDRYGRNELFLNEGPGPDGVPRFREAAEEAGLAFQGFATHATFFDYDRDGDLDAYLLNHTTHYEGTFGHASLRDAPHARAGDRLLRNDGAPGAPRFVDVTAESGVHSGVTGYGLSATVTDVDRDGWPDLYVANDFHENDFLYRNRGDGTFEEVAETAFPHTSRFSMGSDAGDVDGDGYPDLVVLDMLPRDEAVLKTSAASETFEVYELQRRIGFHHQLARNTLQLNRGDGRFSDAGQLAGIQATDWSWAALLADLDLDGRRDLFITNGIYRRPNDLDYVNYLADETVQTSLAQGIDEADLALLRRMPTIPMPNAAFRNAGDLAWEDVGDAWGLGDEGFSNGAAYADLDDDGDLDLVVNNVNAPAAIYRNRAAETTGRNALVVTLAGEGANPFGVGAAVTAWTGGRGQLAEAVPVRGFQSSVDPRLFFGLGAHARADSLTVAWPDGRAQTLRDIPAGALTLRQHEAAGRARPPARPEPLFELAEGVLVPFRHEENTYVDYNRERLMPHKLSTEGPALAVADVDGDGFDDVFLGGAKWKAARLLLARPGGRYVPAADDVWRADSLYEDVDAAFLDADGDGALDLYVVSGGNEFWGENEALRDRLYLGDGRGGFRRTDDALPDAWANGGAVAAGDYDGDGDTDLFVGARVEAWTYGAIPASRLLANDGRGRFTDVTAAVAPELAAAGMVADAAWADVTGDGALDLVVVGEWMPVRVWAGGADGLRERTASLGLDGTEGWWNTVLAHDLDADGDVDLALGNLGLNSKIRARPDEPARLHLKDFDGNGRVEGILTTYKGGIAYPVATRDGLIAQMEMLRRRYPTYTSFGGARYEDLFTDEERAGAETRVARTFASAVARNEGGRFVLTPLPTAAQLAPIYAFLPLDADGDGALDLLAAGGFYGVQPARGRYDASYGVLLRGDGAGGFAAVHPLRMGVALTGQVRGLAALRGDLAPLVLAARNDDAPVVLRLRPPAAPDGSSDRAPLAAR